MTPPGPAARLPDGDASVDDLAALYHALLGRDAEPHVLQRPPGRPLHDIAREMAASDELRQQVLQSLVQQRAVPHARLGPAALRTLDAWLGTRLGCPAVATPQDADVPDTDPDPLDVLARVHAHPVIAAWLAAHHAGLAGPAAEALDARRRAAGGRLAGQIEFVNREFIAGWALDTRRRQGRRPVVVRHDGRVVGSAVAHSHRPDLQRQFGGDGLAGFRVPWRPEDFPPGQALVFTLHDAQTGAVLGEPYRFDNSFVSQLGVAQLLSLELAEIQRRIDALAAMVPQALSYSAFPVERWDLYRRVHRVPPPPVVAAPPPRFVVHIDATGAHATAVRLTIDALRAAPADAAVPWTARVAGGDAEVRAAVAMLAAADPRLSPDDPGADAPPPADADWLLRLDAGVWPDPTALAWLAAGVQQHPDAVLLYADADHLSHPAGQAPQRLPRHGAPVLRDPFDPEALLELDTVGHQVAVRADVLRRVQTALPQALSRAAQERLRWALAAQGRGLHLPQPLFSCTDAMAADAGDAAPRPAIESPQALAPWLPASWQGRDFTRVPDPLWPGAPKPLVRWHPRAPRSVISVIIPTRDHIDLVRDCVDSLHALARHPDALDIVVVDNGSTDPATLDTLARLQAEGRLRVRRVDEPFNWSRLNNLAAADAPGESLLFLNNDTRMLTPEWDDVLRGLLERPDVGAVGARLVYEDGTIQHAGILFGTEGLAAHEAVAEAPDAPGAVTRSALTRTVRGVTGAFLACRRSTFARVGPFEEQRLTVAYNDVEWCLRLADRAPDLAIVYAPLLSLVHLESKSRGFDFLDPVKQRRADYERLCLDTLAVDGLRHAAGRDASRHSVWARPRRALQ